MHRHPAGLVNEHAHDRPLHVARPATGRRPVVALQVVLRRDLRARPIEAASHLGDVPMTG